jgi:hypothetical protein
MQTEDRQTQIVQQQQQQKESTMETASAVGGGHGRYGKDNKKHTNEGIRKDDVYEKEPVEMEQMRSRTKTMTTTTTMSMLTMTATTVATSKKDQEDWVDETKQSAVRLVPQSLPGSKGKKPKTTHAQKTASADPLVSRGGRHQAVRLVPQSLPGSKGNHPQTTHAHMTASADPLVSRGGSHPAVHLVPKKSRFKSIMQELLEASQPQATARTQQTWRRFSRRIQLQRVPQCPPQEMLRVGRKLLEAEISEEFQRTQDKQPWHKQKQRDKETADIEKQWFNDTYALLRQHPGGVDCMTFYDHDVLLRDALHDKDDRLATCLMEVGYLGMDRCFMITRVLLYLRNRLREDIRNSITPLSTTKLEEQAQLRKEQYHQAILEQANLARIIDSTSLDEMEYIQELLQRVLIKRLKKESYLLKEEKKHRQDAKNRMEEAMMEAVRQWQATPKYQRLLKRQQDQLEALHQQQLNTNRQVEIQRKHTLREQEERGFRQRMQAAFQQLEMQRTLHKEALRRREAEMQRQRANARHKKDQKSRNKIALTQQPSTCATTPLTPESQNQPKMTSSVSQKKPETPLSFALIKLHPQKLHPRPQHSMSTPIFTTKTRKLPSKVRRPYSHAQRAPQSPWIPRKALSMQPYDNHFYCDRGPLPTSHLSYLFPNVSQHHAWITPPHRKTLRQQPF